jgi:hypothetical protein
MRRPVGLSQPKGLADWVKTGMDVCLERKSVCLKPDGEMAVKLKRGSLSNEPLFLLR